ncbi:MAG: serine hydrolase [Planctomycetales bacterium]|nr:serine hydrolase [Planctomycetales bacterium]
MKNSLAILSCGFVTVMASMCVGQTSLPRNTPESQGVSSTALLELTNALDEQFDGIHSLMIARNGSVIAEGWWTPYDAEHKHVLYSLSKSFTSTAVGFAVAEGKLTVDDRVVDFFPDDVPDDASANLKAMRVRDILTMTAGHETEPSASPIVVSAKSFLANPVPHAPGTHFKYNTAATFMQSAIVQKQTGETILDYLGPRLFEPLDIEGPVWDTNFQGISLGGYGLRVRTEDIAKFGQLYLQKGMWNGKQLLPKEWIDLATTKQVPNGSNPESDWNQGYGFQFWRCRHNCYRGDGAFSQFCIVLPEHNTVVAITSGVGDMQGVLNVLWDKLLPALQSSPDTEIAADASANERLRERLANLSVKPAKGKDSSPLADRIFGHQFKFAENDQKYSAVSVRSTEPNRITLSIEWDGRNLQVPAGYRKWERGRATLPGGGLTRLSDEPIAGTYAWTDDNTLVVKFCGYETPFHVTAKLNFQEDTVTFTTNFNVSFGPTEGNAIIGHLHPAR